MLLPISTRYLQVELLTSYEGKGGQMGCEARWLGGGGGWVGGDNGHFTPRAIPNYLCVSVLCTVSASHFHFLCVSVSGGMLVHIFSFCVERKYINMQGTSATQRNFCATCKNTPLLFCCGRKGWSYFVHLFLVFLAVRWTF